MNETFMKEKPILPLLTSMALPMVISMMVNALYNIVDSLFVARINENAMTALSLVFPIQNFVNALAIGFGVGINALIAYFLGAGDKKGADRAATQGLVLALILLYLTVYNKRPIPVKIRKEYLAFHKETDHRLYSIGVPAILNLALPSLLVSVLNGILAAYSQIYVVILGIYYKLQTFLYLPANGIVQGMRPLIGYNYGAGEQKRVKKIYEITLAMSAVIMALGTILCLVASRGLMELFTENAETIAAGGTALRIISAGFIISSVSVTASGALEGLGKGTHSLVISLFRYVILMIPAAFVLCRIFGPTGVWHAFWITEAVTSVIAAYVYHKAAGSRK